MQPFVRAAIYSEGESPARPSQTVVVLDEAQGAAVSRVDLHWGSGWRVREAVWSWRSETKCQIVNPDIDGLLTACLLHQLKGWPVIGFYDTQRLLLDDTHPLPLNLDHIVWVDVDMCWPGARSLSQHVVMDASDDAHLVSAYRMTVNPSLLRGHSRQTNYTTKYPFGTFQWALWLAGDAGAAEPPHPSDALKTGLAWMPDGGFQSVESVWRTNCVDWATRILPGSVLTPLASTDPSRARDAVRTAEAELVRLSGVRRGWRNHQFTLAQGSATGPRLSYNIDEIPDVLQSLCDAIADVYGWQKLQLPHKLETVEGHWRTDDRPPARWPHAADRREVVSLAVTGRHQFCWTEPGDLSAALPSA